MKINNKTPSEQCEQFFQKKLFTLKRDQAVQCQERMLPALSFSFEMYIFRFRSLRMNVSKLSAM